MFVWDDPHQDGISKPINLALPLAIKQDRPSDGWFKMSCSNRFTPVPGVTFIRATWGVILKVAAQIHATAGDLRELPTI